MYGSRFSFFIFYLFLQVIFLLLFFCSPSKNNSVSTPNSSQERSPTEEQFRNSCSSFIPYSIQPLPSFHFFFAKEIPKSTKLIKQAITKAYIRLLFFFFYICLRIYVSSFCIFCWLYLKFSRFHLSDLLYFAYTFFVSFLSRNSVDIYSNIFAPFQSPAPEFNYFEIIITYIYLYIYLNSSRFLCSLTYVAVERNDIFEKPRPNQDRSYFEKSLKYNRLPFSSYNEHIIT